MSKSTSIFTAGTGRVMVRALAHPATPATLFLFVAKFLTLGLSFASAGEHGVFFARLWPGYYLEDALFALFLAGIFTALAWLAPVFVRARATLLAFLLMVLLVCLVALTKYVEMYELPFAWSHMGAVEGGREIWASIKGELRGAVLLALFAGTIVILAWAFWFTRMERARLREFDADAGLSARRRLFNVILCGAALLALGLALAPDFGPTKASLARPERYASGPLRLMGLALISTERPTRELLSVPEESHKPDSDPLKEASAFQFGFDTRSLRDQNPRPRLNLPFPRKKRNIVLYFFEGTSARYIGLKQNGRPVTPTWDRLRENALVFQKHHASNPLSINALFSVLGSAYAMPGQRWITRAFPDIKLPTLSERLKTEGYRNAVMHSAWLDYAGAGAFLKSRGFDLMMDATQLRKPPYSETLNWGVDDRALIRPAVDFARKTKADGRPFFLLLLPISPHHPYDIPEARFQLKSPDLARGNRERSFTKYLNSLHYADFVLGEFLRAMEEADLADDTLFIILSDHGEAFGQHRANYNHPFFIYQENTHAPFLIYNRRLFPRTMIFPDISRHVDVAPTILDLIGHTEDLPRTFEGHSLLRAGPPRLALMDTTWRNDLLGVRDAEWKYILNRRTTREELYDLGRDPEEQNNLAPERADLAREYRALVLKYHAYRKRYYETLVGREIDWNKTHKME